MVLGLVRELLWFMRGLDCFIGSLEFGIWALAEYGGVALASC